MLRSYYQIGLEFLDSAEESGGVVTYYDSATRSRWWVCHQAVEKLGEMLEDKTPDAYSLWCSRTVAHEIQ